MTDEQIIQKANKYANNPRSYDESVAFKCVGHAFIAGAHSRDEEIEELKKQRDNFKDRLLDALEKRDQLRNPWISVEEKLPEDDGLVLTIYWVYKDFYSIELSSYNPKTCEWDCGEFGYRISHWMPIPELE